MTTAILDAGTPPDVSLSIDAPTIDEDGGVATITAKMTTVSGRDVTIDLEFSGTAFVGDFAISSNQILIPMGSLAGTVTITGLRDQTNEADETVVVDISSVEGGNEDGVQAGYHNNP